MCHIRTNDVRHLIASDCAIKFEEAVLMASQG